MKKVRIKKDLNLFPLYFTPFFYAKQTLIIVELKLKFKIRVDDIDQDRSRR